MNLILGGPIVNKNKQEEDVYDFLRRGLPCALGSTNTQQPPTPPISSAYIPKLAIRYNSTPATYLGGYNAGSNVIQVATIVPDTTGGNTDANTGLSYDFVNDQIIVKELVGFWSIFFDRTLTEITRQRAGVAGFGTQGVAYDHTMGIIIDYFGTGIQEYRKSDGVVVYAQSNVVPAPYTSGGLFFNPFTGILSFTNDTSNYVLNYKKVGGVWTGYPSDYPGNRTWFSSGEGVGYDFITNKILGNGSSIQERDFIGGLNIKNFIKPTTETKTVVEGIIGDPKDGSFWFNSDEFYHGAVVGGNRLWHVDPRGWYLQYLRFPDMIPYSMWKLDSGASVLGTYSVEVLYSDQFNIAPIVDYGVNIGQQTIGNFTVNHGTENEISATTWADFEFRGSAIAPTTTGTTFPAYLPLTIYNSNQSNDGWGSTVPGAWQSSPTNHRYMQFRLKPKVQVPVIPPATPLSILGDNCKLWLEMFSTLNMTINPDNNQILTIPNKARMNDVPFADLELGRFSQANSGSQGVFSTDKVNFASGKYVSMEHMSEISSDQQGELIAVFRRTVATSFGIPFGASDPATNNNQLRFLHLRSSDAVANSYDMDIVDSAGTLSRAQTAADNNIVHKMVCWNSDGSTIREYVNKVLQTTTMNPGTNNGPWFGDFAFTGITIGSILRQSGAIVGSTDIRLIVYANRILTTQERSNIYDYCVAKGLI